MTRLKQAPVTPHLAVQTTSERNSHSCLRAAGSPQLAQGPCPTLAADEQTGRQTR